VTWAGDKYESEPAALENIIGQAQAVVDTDFDDLPSHLKLLQPDVEIFSSQSHCFAKALANLLPNNVAACNAYADRFRYDNIPVSTCVRACEENKIPVRVIKGRFPTSKKASLKKAACEAVQRYPSGSILLYDDHAVSVKAMVVLDYSITKWNHVNVLLNDPEEDDRTWL